MSSRCTFAHEHDVDSPEVAEHATACGTCAEAVARRVRARSAWQWARLRDDATERSARERRLKSVGGVRRTQRARVAWPPRAIASVAALLALAWVVWLARSPHRPERSAGQWPAVTPTTTEKVSVAPAASISSSSSDPGLEVPAERGLRVVAVDGGASDGAHRRLEVGRTLRSGDAIDVPSGGFVDVGYLVDTASWIGITGPAEADVREERSTALVVLHRGTAHATAGRGVIVATDAVRTRGEHASWIVEATPECTRVRATLGRVDVESTGSLVPARILSTGDALAVDTPEGRATTLAVASATGDAASSWRSAEKALDEGDRAAAESSLRNVLAHEREPARRARAALRLSELLLARGEKGEARADLAPLALGRDPAIASDAVWLYVRSFPTPRDRADAWARYLATSPSPPMMQVARVERARELFDAGDRTEARAIVEGLSREALAPVAADALDRLRTRLDEAPGDAGGR